MLAQVNNRKPLGVRLEKWDDGSALRLDLSYLEAHLTRGFLGDPVHGSPLAQTILEQPNPPNFQMSHHLPQYYGTSHPEDHLSVF
ncbi:unnamed protein product [Linum trigynum]|uniref:Uncharacterized protein n=1 Tax=Linum trigynum TaxID=586398 RepID=A0AAV2CSJ0_9ROSI